MDFYLNYLNIQVTLNPRHKIAKELIGVVSCGHHSHEPTREKFKEEKVVTRPEEENVFQSDSNIPPSFNKTS